MMMGITISLTGRLLSGAFSPAILFQSNEPGFWYDPSDLTTLFQDTAGTTPVTAPGQTVARINDKSGNNNHGFPTGATLRQTDEGLNYIEYSAGGGLTVALPSAFSPASVAVLQPDRQAYQTRTGVAVSTSFAITENHGPIVIVGRNISTTENARLNTWASLNLNGVGPMPWTRNPSWLSLPTVGDTEEKFVGLIAVYPQANFTAFTAAGNYTVDWGDGTTNNYTTGATALKEFDYADAELVGTDAPVTLTSATNRVSRTAHGYSSGDRVPLWNVTGSTGISSGQVYYVINATADDFQISETLYGSPVVFGADGTATLLPYRQAIVTVTPQAGQQLTALNLNVRHTQVGLQAYETGWLDIEVGSPNFSASGLVIRSSAETVRMRMVERIRIANLGNQTTMVNMFQSCSSLQSVPLFDTSAVTNMGSMFQSCSSLQSVPLFDTSAVTSMATMFQNCFSLQSVPLFDTAAVTTMASMFFNCYSLQSVPLFDTSAVTSMATMFNNCVSLQSVPLFDTSAVTNMSSMFNNCVSLQSVPLFDTSAVTSMATMFQSCSSLQSVPLFDTSAVTNMGSMFQNCFSLQSVPALVTTAVSSSTNFANMFLNCNSVARIEAKDFNFTFSVANCKLSAAALDEIYTNLPVVVGQTITVSGNYGTTGDDPTIATAKGWTVTG